MSKNQVSYRITSLDLLRGIAAIIVVIWHYQFYFNSKPLLGLLFPFFTDGQLAVDTFFVISGFVLSYAHGNRLVIDGGLRRFLIKRIARLYPLHLASLLVTALLFLLVYVKTGKPAYYVNDAFHFVLNLTLTQYIGLQDSYSFNGPSWSISTEFWVNVLYGVIMAMWGRFIVPISLLLIVAASAFLLLVIGQWSVGPKYDGWIESELLRTIADFFAGVMVHYAWSRYGRDNVLGTIALLLGAAVTLCAMMVGHTHAVIEMLASVGGGSLLVWGCSCSRGAKVLAKTQPGRWIGDISYSIYLWHFPAAMVLSLLNVDVLIGTGPGFLCLYLVFILTVSHFSYVYLENPARLWVTRIALPDTPRTHLLVEKTSTPAVTPTPNEGAS
ncbi:acyltransferase family protein [Bradyrhizobium genosp. P]|uniref:acyltransferase family protein n=1 Tax=Bradyrhizobium genosp. P TaxID=83641 RepID=UPI003CEF725F